MSIWNEETFTYKVDDIELDVYYEYAHAEPQTHDYCGSPAEINITAVMHCVVCIWDILSQNTIDDIERAIAESKE
tara:strand:- start:1356 stop:1580 length:225 start_codon:yes stop_codon:yes gene_type:complete